MSLSRETIIVVTAPDVPALRIETATDGALLALTGLPAGSLRMDVIPGRTDPVLPTSTVIDTTASTPVRVRLRRAQALRGTVLDAQGAPVVAAEVRVALDADSLSLGFAGSVATPTLTDASGGFELRALDPDVAYVVAASGWGGLGVACAAAASPGGAELVLVVRAGVARKGRLLSRDGQGVEGVTLIVMGDDGLPSAWTQTDSDGRFVLAGAPAAGGRLVARRRTPDRMSFRDTDLGAIDTAREELDLTID